MWIIIIRELETSLDYYSVYGPFDTKQEAQDWLEDMLAADEVAPHERIDVIQLRKPIM